MRTVDNSENSERLLEFEIIHSGQGVDKPRYFVLKKIRLSTTDKGRSAEQKFGLGVSYL